MSCLVYSVMEPENDDYLTAMNARNGDSGALSEFVERMRVRLFSIAYGELHHYDDAHDAVASALLRICRSIEDVRDPGAMAGWMAAIVRNEAARLRQHRRQTLANLPVEGADEAGRTEMLVESAPDSALKLDREAAMRRIPEDQARAIALHYFGGLSIREIALRTQRPEGTVKSWLHFGRVRLAKEMEDYGNMNQKQIAPTAAIISTDIDAATLKSLATALKAAGFGTVHLISDYVSVGMPISTGQGEAKELHLPEALDGAKFIVLDEWIAGRSAFELLPLLRATVEAVDLHFCLLLNNPGTKENDIAIHSASITGLDLVLNKPVKPAEFEKFAAIIHKQIVDG